MAVRESRRGLQSWVPGLFAGFWIVLAAFSAAYLYQVITTPQANRAATAVATPAEAPAAAPAAPGGAPALSEQQAEALIQASEAKDQEISALKASVQDLSGQLAQLNTRLKPLEKVLGPVAELTTSTSVTTSPPAPGAMRPPDPPKPPAPPAAEAAPPPAPTPKPVEARAAEQTPTPEADHAVAEAADAAPEAPPSTAVTTDEPDDASPPEETQTAAVAPAPSIPPGTTRFGIEIGSVDKQDGVRAMWRDLLTNHAALVAGLEARRVIAPDNKWRLIAGPFASAAEAMQACGLFKKVSMPCEATVFAGDSF